MQLKPAGVQKCLSENFLPVRVFSIHGDKLEAHEQCGKPTICQSRKEEKKHSSQIPRQGTLPHTLFSNEDHILVGVEGSQEVDEVLLVVSREDDLLIIAVESIVWKDQAEDMSKYGRPGEIELAPYLWVGFVEDIHQLLVLDKVHLLLLLLLLFLLIGELFLVDLEHQDVLLVKLLNLVRLDPKDGLEVLLVKSHIHLLQMIVNQTVPKYQKQLQTKTGQEE